MPAPKGPEAQLSTAEAIAAPAMPEPTATATADTTVVHPIVTPQEEVHPTPADADQAALAAFEKGVEAVTDTDEPAPAAVPPAVVPDPADPAADPVDVPAVEPTAAQKVDDEIKELGITNERTQKRFRELSERAAEVEPLRARAAAADEWEDLVLSTGASPEQFGQTMNYLKAMSSGDPQSLEAAHAMLTEGLAELSRRLGRAGPGVDPLADHADLQAQVNAGDMDRKFAEELAQARARAGLETERTAQQQQTATAEAAQREGVNAVAALGQRLRTSDPDFERKFAFLGPAVELIQRTMPPAQWAGEIERAWTRLPPMPAPAAPRAPGPMPLRPAGASTQVARTPANDVDAFQLGVDRARSAGL